MKIHDTYFDTQNQALEFAYSTIPKKYQIKFPEYLWTESVNYGSYVRYCLPLQVIETANIAKKCLHITLYRMDSGSYELTNYVM